MSATIISTTSDFVTVQVKIPLSNTMLEGEDWIQDAVNEVGTLATGELLKKFDSDGSVITLGAVKMTSKGLVPKRNYSRPIIL